jgi:two-component system, response regulator FlrC
MNTARVLVVEDDAALRMALSDTLEIAGFDVITAEDAEAGLAVVRGTSIDVVVSDVQMAGMDGHALLERIKTLRSDLPVLLMTAYATVERAVEAMRAGAADYLVKPFEAEVLVTRVHELLPRELDPEADCVAVDPRTRAIFTMATRVAESEATVLLTGESGTGKEVMFRYIHAHSRRSRGPAVAVNCAAIPENMLEAMLFGYEKGAFTGAYKSCAGKFEQAQAGSLLLDEVTEMSLPLQAKLLRVLQEREVERLGAGSPIQLDVRVVATTNRSLVDEVAAGRFREDLYYRLNVFPLLMPPLRERPLDVIPLAQYLLARAAGRSQSSCPQIEADACELLQAHDWPGNVRELDNVMQRALILHSDGRIRGIDIHLQPVGSRISSTPAPAATPEPVLPSGIVVAAPEETLGDELRQRERQLILEALKEGRGSRKYVAEKLGISSRTLRYKLARLKEQGVQVPRA